MSAPAPSGGVRQIVERCEREVERGHLRSAIELLERAVAMGAELVAVRRVLDMLYRRAGSSGCVGLEGRGRWMRPGHPGSSRRADPGRPRPPSRG